jgi:hypothetical protein
MAVTLDIGESNNIHPADKKNVVKDLLFGLLLKIIIKKLFIQVHYINQ